MSHKKKPDNAIVKAQEFCTENTSNTFLFTEHVVLLYVNITIIITKVVETTPYILRSSIFTGHFLNGRYLFTNTDIFRPIILFKALYTHIGVYV